MQRRTEHPAAAAPGPWLFRQPALLLGLTSLFWAGNAIAGQLSVGEIQPFLLVLLRWVIVSVMLWPFYGAEVRAHWPAIRPRLPRIALMATMGFTAFNALFYAASHQTTAVNIGILQGSIPVFVLAGAFLVHRTPVGRVQALGVAVTMVGVVMVATRGDPLAALAIGLNPGDMLMLAACVLYAFYTVQLQTRPAMPPTVFFALMCPIAAVTAIPFVVGEALVSGFRWPTPEGWLVTAYVAIFPSCLAQIFFLRGVDLIGPGAAGVYVNLVPIFAAILAIVLLGQDFAAYHAVALALVIGGIWLAQRHGRAA